MPVFDEELKPFFVKWLEREAIAATKRGSRLALLYNKALDSLRRHNDPITCPKDLKAIRYFGDKTIESLTNYLRQHCQANNLEVPIAFTTISESIGQKRSSELLQARQERPSKVQKQKPYVPKHRSGGYAIMIALYIRDKARNGLNKDEIIRIATPFADRSFTSNPAANDFYSAWNSIKVLIKHELVSFTGHAPKIYYLTSAGIELAKQLKIAEGLKSSPLREESAQEMSFDNNVRVSPESSFSKSLQDLYKSPTIVSKKSQILEEFNVSTGERRPLYDLKQNSHSIPNSSSPIRSDILRETPSKSFVVPHRKPSSSKSKDNTENEENEENVQVDGLQSSIKQTTSLHTHDRTNRIYAGINYEIWKKEEFDVILIVDNREIRSQTERDFFYSRLTKLGINNEIRPLPLGDVTWVARHKVSHKEAILNHICERKRLDDLAFSIKDGRFQEQKNRLTKSAMKHCYYLVEETNASSFISNMGDALQTAISMTVMISNFHLKRFKDIDETIAFLAVNTRVIKEDIISKDKHLMVLKPRTIENQNEYSRILNTFRDKFELNGSSKYECVHSYPIFQSAMAKTGMITVKEMFIMMLMTIKGVSLEKGIVIQNSFPTPSHLIRFYKEENGHLPESEKKLLLMKHSINQVGNKKIGKVVSEKIYEIWGASA
ncbi:crossover junction endonuclease MUS81 [Scheffersomyces amazonensis]|uniref:crossover junction endonuclease MUS81 n=1 Tax=Scheffersomyces amazonensis TaxID=1078765 RepID=UPI00315CC34B